MRVESADGIELLLDAGLERRVVGSADVEIRDPHGLWTLWHVKVLRHSPSPSEIELVVQGARKRPHDGVFFVVARAGQALTAAAQQNAHVAYAAVDQGVVRIFGELHDAGIPDPSEGPGTARTSWTRLGALRVFALVDHPLTQSELARQIGVSHVSVGKQLAALEPLIERTQNGWRALHRADCWDAFMAQYPGPRGLSTFWSATGDLADQLARLERIMHDHEHFVISGDIAADFYAPWRRPTRITAYVTRQPPLDEHGFATVRGADATIELRVPRDPTIYAMSRISRDRNGAQRRFADPLITAWDVSRGSGGDVESAVARIRERALHDSARS
jgi:hypothetical protein